MGFPVDMFPVLFAIPRTAGWIAQWEEMLTDPDQKIARPRQIYIGPTARDYVPRDKRRRRRPCQATTVDRCSCARRSIAMSRASGAPGGSAPRRAFDGARAFEHIRAAWSRSARAPAGSAGAGTHPRLHHRRSSSRSGSPSRNSRSRPQTPHRHDSRW